MTQIDTMVSSKVSFETNGIPAWSKILHNIASDIEGDGLKIKRMAIFEQPLLARIYIKDTTFKPVKQKRFLDMFRPQTDQNIYDYIVCLELQERPLFKGAYSYKVERCLYLNDIQTSKRLQLSNRFKEITHLLSNKILKHLINAGGRNFETCNVT